VIPRTRWARTVDGAYIAYQDHGEGPLALVVINGWVSHQEVYWEQPRYARFMERLRASFRVLTFDKRGTGMSDRVAGAQDLETRMDDVRAVMDAASIERAALFGWGLGGSALALFFAATHPERTVGVCTDAEILQLREPGYPWAPSVEEDAESLETLVRTWGDPEQIDEFLAVGFENEPGDVPVGDRDFAAWAAKFARFSATPGSYAAFHRIWNETDVRDVLSAVQVPALVYYKLGSTNWNCRDHAAYLAQHVPGARLEGLAGSSPVPWIEKPEPLASAIEKFLAALRDEEADLDRVLATVVFTDIVGSSAHAAKLGDRAWRDLVEQHHRTTRTLLARYRGAEIDTAGDGFFASFDGPARAVRCARAIADAVVPLGLEVRAGVHTGEIETIDGKLGGIAVTIGARIGSLAGPSEVLVSQTVKDLTAGSGITFDDAGEHDLKGVPGRWRVFRALDR